MNNIRLTFHTSTNLKLPIGVFRVLQQDAYYYGFVKNEKPNISGFLNQLLPPLSDYQEDLFQELLKYNNGNKEIAEACARSIHNVYLCPFTFRDDGDVNVPFRISQNKYDDFILIHDERLGFYHTDFSGYIRTLLSEYASKTLEHREYLYAYRMVDPLRDAMRKGNIVKFYTDDAVFVFAPVFIEASPIYGHNYIVGIDSTLQPQIVRLSEVKKALIQQERIHITEEMCDSVYTCLENKYEEESIECSD